MFWLPHQSLGDKLLAVLAVMLILSSMLGLGVLAVSAW